MLSSPFLEGFTGPTEHCHTSARGAAFTERLFLFFAGAGIKAQVCSLMELLTTTLYQAHALFYVMPEGVPPDPALPCGLLFSTLESTTGQQPAGEHPASSSSVYRQEAALC